MLQARPGAYCLHRQRRRRRIVPPATGSGPCMLHNPSYDFNDELIPLGATYWIRLVEKFLGR